MSNSGGKGIDYAFQGMYDHSLDPKGRLTLPSSFRDQLNHEREIVFAIGFDKTCLTIYPSSAWRAVLERLKALPRTDPEATSVKRVLSWTAFPSELDRQGRVLVPYQLRELVGITRDVKVAGAIECVEVWDRARWEEYFRQGADQLASNASKLPL